MMRSLRSVLAVCLVVLGTVSVAQAQVPTFPGGNRDRAEFGADPNRGLIAPPVSVLQPSRPSVAGQIQPRWKLGVEGEDLEVGVRLTHIYNPTPASRAGLEVNDVIISINGFQVGLVNGILFDIGDELQKRVDSRGYVNLLVWNRRDRSLVNRVVRLERAVSPLPNRRTGTVTGTVFYRERIAMYPQSVVEVRLLDVTDRNRQPYVIADQTISNPAQVPVPFLLEYNTDDIDPRRVYAVEAQIWSQGRLRWSTSAAVPVITNGNPTRNIDLQVIGASRPSIFDLNNSGQ